MPEERLTVGIRTVGVTVPGERGRGPGPGQGSVEAGAGAGRALGLADPAPEAGAEDADEAAIGSVQSGWTNMDLPPGPTTGSSLRT